MPHAGTGAALSTSYKLVEDITLVRYTINAEACLIHDFASAIKASYILIPAGDPKESSLKAHHTQNSADGDCNQDKGTHNSP